MFYSSYVKLKLPLTTFYIYKEKLFNNFGKILKKCFAAIDGTTI